MSVIWYAYYENYLVLGRNNHLYYLILHPCKKGLYKGTFLFVNLFMIYTELANWADLVSKF